MRSVAPMRASASVALGVLALLAYVQPSTSDAVSDFYSNLVAMPSKLARTVEKKGMIPTERWDDKSFNFEPFHQWVLNSSIYQRSVSRNYPMSYPCGVWVNHHYKFLFIRNRKAASTTVTDNFDKCHYSAADPKLCMEVCTSPEPEGGAGQVQCPCVARRRGVEARGGKG